MGKRGTSKAPRIESHGPRNRPWEPSSRRDGLAGSSASGTAVPGALSRFGVSAAASGRERPREVGPAGEAPDGVGGGTTGTSVAAAPAALPPRSGARVALGGMDLSRIVFARHLVHLPLLLGIPCFAGAAGEG